MIFSKEEEEEEVAFVPSFFFIQEKVEKQILDSSIIFSIVGETGLITVFSSVSTMGSSIGCSILNKSKLYV
jgi:hypothetical protein